MESLLDRFSTDPNTICIGRLSATALIVVSRDYRELILPNASNLKDTGCHSCQLGLSP